MSVYRAVIAARDAIESDDCPLSSKARQLWQYLASKADRSGTCYPSNETVGRAICIGADAVRKYRRELEAYGALSMDVEAHGRGQVNTYRLVLAAVRDTGPHGPVSVEEYRSTRTGIQTEYRSEYRSTRTAHIGEVGEVVREPPRDHTDGDAERARATYANYAAGMRAMGAVPVPPQAYWLAHAADTPDVWTEAQRA